MSYENQNHIQIRDKIKNYLKEGISIENISKILSLPLGTRWIKGSIKWYKFCIIMKNNQKKAIEKHPNLYSKAGKIAQKKHPWIGKSLGKKYGKVYGKLRIKQIKESGNSSEYYSNMAKKLQKINPNHSRNNMKKAHETMIRLGKFNEHQKLAALRCMEKNPNQLKEMSKRAHNLHPLSLLALESRRKNFPYKFMDCLFDSNSEREFCKYLVKYKLIDKPKEGINLHFKINKHHIDFFIKNELFIEFHPPRKFGRNKEETIENYYKEKREILDRNGYKNYPLIVIDSLKDLDSKMNKIKQLMSLKLNHRINRITI